MAAETVYLHGGPDLYKPMAMPAIAPGTHAGPELLPAPPAGRVTGPLSVVAGGRLTHRLDHAALDRSLRLVSRGDGFLYVRLRACAADLREAPLVWDPPLLVHHDPVADWLMALVRLTGNVPPSSRAEGDDAVEVRLHEHALVHALTFHAGGGRGPAPAWFLTWDARTRVVNVLDPRPRRP